MTLYTGRGSLESEAQVESDIAWSGPSVRGRERLRGKCSLHPEPSVANPRWPQGNFYQPPQMGLLRIPKKAMLNARGNPSEGFPESWSGLQDSCEQRQRPRHRSPLWLPPPETLAHLETSIWAKTTILDFDHETNLKMSQYEAELKIH